MNYRTTETNSPIIVCLERLGTKNGERDKEEEDVLV